jgi:hypothetical protein
VLRMEFALCETGSSERGFLQIATLGLSVTSMSRRSGLTRCLGEVVRLAVPTFGNELTPQLSEVAAAHQLAGEAIGET